MGPLKIPQRFFVVVDVVDLFMSTPLLPFQVNSMLVYVEKKVLEDPAIVNDESFGSVKKRFCTFSEGT